MYHLPNHFKANYNDLLMRVMGPRGANVIGPDPDNELSDFDADQLAALKRAAPRLGPGLEAALLRSMREHDALAAEDNPYAAGTGRADRDWAGDATDTRFETESDIMEMCDLAEIL